MKKIRFMDQQNIIEKNHNKEKFVLETRLVAQKLSGIEISVTSTVSLLNNFFQQDHL